MSIARRGIRRGVLIPVARAAGQVSAREARVWVDERTNRLKIKHSNGTVVDLERIASAGNGTTAQIITWDTTTTNGPAWRGWAEMGTRLQREGVHIWEDWELPSTEQGEYGRLGWVKHDVGGGGATISKIAPIATGWSECGIIRLTTPAPSGNGVAMSQGNTTGCPLAGPPPTEGRFVAKLRVDTTFTQLTAWAGLFYNASTIPDAAVSNAVHAIGVVARATTGTANWFGICRNGSGETSVDLGVAADGTWRELGWRKTGTGVQFQVAGVDTGSEITANLPGTTKALGPAVGIAAESASARELRCDYIGVSCPVTRY